MNESQQQEMPQKYMAEIYRHFLKLKEGGISTGDMTLVTTTEVIGDKLVYTDKLSVDGTDIAVATRIDPNSLEQIKLAIEQQKVEVDDYAVAKKAEIDELIAVIEPKLKPKEKPVEEVVDNNAEEIK